MDKRTSLEIRVAKEQMLSLSGTLRWVSSERQYADGLTKCSTRKLLAERLRHGRLKLVWDPSYTSAKRKDAQAREQSRNEFAKTKKQKYGSNRHSTDNSPLPSTPHATPFDIIDEETDEGQLAPTSSAFFAQSLPRSFLGCVVYFSQIKGAMAEGMDNTPEERN